jgi:hypothetical protein
VRLFYKSGNRVFLCLHSSSSSRKFCWVSLDPFRHKYSSCLQPGRSVCTVSLSVCPLLIVANVYSWPAAVGVRALPPPSRRVSIASLNSVQHRAHPTVFNSEHSKFACTVSFVRERRNAYSIFQTVFEAKFNLWNQHYVNCHKNTIGTESPTCFGTVWVPSLGDRHFFNSIIKGAFPLWWRSRNAETCRKLCVCFVHIAVYVSLLW